MMKMSAFIVSSVSHVNPKCLTLTGQRELVIHFTCDVMHTPTSFPRTAIIGMYACVAGRLTLPDYLWSMKATLDSYSFVIH